MQDEIARLIEHPSHKEGLFGFELKRYIKTANPSTLARNVASIYRGQDCSDDLIKVIKLTTCNLKVYAQKFKRIAKMIENGEIQEMQKKHLIGKSKYTFFLVCQK